jgi:hypothetical protein
MKKITTISIMILILGTSSLFALSNDYAIVNNYKLLNDMKFAKKQQELIIDMSQALESDTIDSITLEISKEKFSQILFGLEKGNKLIKLNGTNIPEIKAKLVEVQTIWMRELKKINTLVLNSNNRESVIEGLNDIMIKMSETVALYNKSYNRFKQKSKLSSLVNHHMNNNKNKIFAFNLVE